MEEERLAEIKNKINKLKVVEYQEEKIASNSNFLSIIKGNYTLANHQIITRETMVKNTGTGNAVCIFAITEDNKIILVIQPRVSLTTQTKINIELPAGYIEEEDTIEAAKRELQEETGYISDKWVHLDNYYPSQGASSEKIDLVLALNSKKTTSQKLDFDEYVEWIEVNLEEYEYLLEQQYMLDANCRIAYYKVLEYLTKTNLESIVNALIRRKKTIATMESCTGGYLASCITNIENASKVLKYSAVTYSNEYKIKMGVDKKIIDKYSVYSKECAREMAHQISNFAISDYGVGITGTLKKYDESNKTIENDKVYVCIYCKKENKYFDEEYKLTSNSRINNKRTVVNHIANILKEIIK